MSALVEMLYPAPVARRTPVAIIGWWESRRWMYNRVVGCAGLFTMGVVGLFSLLPGGPPPMPFEAMFVAPLVYGIAANLCYTSGWAIELFAKAVWGHRAPHVGPLLFREGLLFSVGLTLLPVPVFVIISTLVSLAFRPHLAT